MCNPNLYTAQLKLKRHKIRCESLNNEEGFVIGSAQSVRVDFIVRVISPAIIGIALIIAGLVYEIGMFEVFGGLLGIFTAHGYRIHKNKRSNNQSQKIIAKGSLTIITDLDELLFTANNILNIEVKMLPMEGGEFEGKIILNSSAFQQQVILTLSDSDEKVLKDDLLYLKRLIELYISEEK